MQALNILQFPDQLTSLEDEAQIALDESIKALAEFVSILEVIQDSALWQKDYPSWPAYLWKRWGLKSSTLRGYRATVRTGDMIMSIVSSETVTKAQADKMRRILPTITSDRNMQIQAYAKAYELTGNIAPSKAELQIAYDEIYKVTHEKVYTINGVDYPAGQIDKAIMDGNISEDYFEKDQRQGLYIDASQGVESKRLDGTKAELLAFLQNAPDGTYSLFWKQKVGE